MSKAPPPAIGQMTSRTGAVINFQVNDYTKAADEPRYNRTNLPGGFGLPITPERLLEVCADAMEQGRAWRWIHEVEDRPGRNTFVLLIPVQHRWFENHPIRYWNVTQCIHYPAAYLADWTFFYEERDQAERDARHRQPEPTGWRGVWARWFPSSRNPVIPPTDRIWKPPPGYFKIPKGDSYIEPGAIMLPEQIEEP